MESQPGRKLTKKTRPILTDLHVHIEKDISPYRLAAALDGAILALTVVENGSREPYLSYEDALERLQADGAAVKEIDSGLFAEFRWENNHGYFLKAQEIIANHHILGIGIRTVLPNPISPQDAIQAIQEQGGLAVLPHPFVVEGRWLKYRMIKGRELSTVRELAGMVDEIEVFNAQNINLFPVLAWMNRANRMALSLALELGFKGIAATDSHHSQQVKTSGILLPQENLTFSSIKRQIRDKNFERKEGYVPVPSFLRSHLSLPL